MLSLDSSCSFFTSSKLTPFPHLKLSTRIFPSSFSCQIFLLHLQFALFAFSPYYSSLFSPGSIKCPRFPTVHPNSYYWLSLLWWKVNHLSAHLNTLSLGLIQICMILLKIFQNPVRIEKKNSNPFRLVFRTYFSGLPALYILVQPLVGLGKGSSRKWEYLWSSHTG